MSEGSLPLYYRESFFSKDSLLHPELKAGQPGIAGDPVPYTVRGDDAITCVLLFCFVVTLLSFAHSRNYILHQLKSFLYFPLFSAHNSQSEGEGKFFIQLFLSILTCLLLAILSYFYVTNFITETFVLDAPYQVIAIYCGLFMLYFLCKTFVYNLVNSIFFGGKKSRQWTWTFTFITALEGVALFPAVMLLVYFDLNMQYVVYYFTFVLFFTKILTFSKCWLIFFKQISVFLQIILYLCALEIIPLLSLAGALILITDQLKVNF